MVPQASQAAQAGGHTCQQALLSLHLPLSLLRLRGCLLGSHAPHGREGAASPLRKTWASCGGPQHAALGGHRGGGQQGGLRGGGAHLQVQEEGPLVGRKLMGAWCVQRTGRGSARSWCAPAGAQVRAAGVCEPVWSLTSWKCRVETARRLPAPALAGVCAHICGLIQVGIRMATALW